MKRLRRQVRDDERGEEDVHERDFEEEDPAEQHQLIVAEAGQRPAHPDEDEEERGDFPEEGRDVEKAAEDSAPAFRVAGDVGPVKAAAPRWDRQVPAAEEE